MGLATDRPNLSSLRSRLAASGAPPCGMAHERVRHDLAGRPLPATVPNADFSRPAICPASVRATHLGCSHTMARYALAEALAALASGDDPALDRLHELEGGFGTLDHRRHAAESRKAVALLAADASGIASAEASIADLVAEHRVMAADALTLRDAVLVRLDAALADTT